MPDKPIERQLGYRFSSAALLQQALTHRSHGVPHNERLEFLGDGLLNFVVARLLFQQFTTLPEGDLSRLRAGLVNQQALSELATSLSLGDHLHLGEGELKSGGFRRPSILADAFEALIGAISLDGGFDAAEKVLTELYRPLLRPWIPGPQAIRIPRPTCRSIFRAGGWRCRNIRSYPWQAKPMNSISTWSALSRNSPSVPAAKVRPGGPRSSKPHAVLTNLQPSTNK